MKTREFVKVRNLTLILSAFPVRSSKETPVIYETYEGNKGSTQGDRKDRTPAKEANG